MILLSSILNQEPNNRGNYTYHGDTYANQPHH